MKRKFLFFLTSFVCFSSMAQTDETFSLNDAIKQKKITVTGKYNESSVHYLKPVILTIVSLMNRVIKLKIESGDLMEPEDSTCQTMMVTGDLILLLKPGESKKIEPYGMCTEPNDGAGRKGLVYFFKPNENKELIEIAKFINDNKYKDGVGQNAVWCVADKRRDLLDINGYDSASRLKLITKVAEITHKPIPDAKLLKQSYTDYTAPKITETIGGMFEFKFAKTTKVHIAMFNSRGTLVRELYFNPTEKPGIHKVSFEFDYTVYTDEYYMIKLIAEEEVLLTSRVDRDEDNWEDE